MALEKSSNNLSCKINYSSHFLDRVKESLFWRKISELSLYVQDNFLILLILLFGLILRAYAGSDSFIHEWDERYHALVAKNLTKHFLIPTLYDHPVLNYDYQNWGGNYIWLHKPPIALWLMALSIKIFGLSEIALRLPSIFLSTLSIFFTFRIGSIVFGKKVGLLASFFHSINGFLINLAAGRMATDHVDSIFLSFIEFAVFVSINFARTKNKWLIPLTGAILGVIVLTKSLPGLIIFPICIVLIQNNEKWKGLLSRSLVLLSVAAVVCIPWLLYIHYSFPKESSFEHSYNLRHLWEPLEGHAGTILHHIKRMPKFFGELVWIPILWFCAFYMWVKRDYKIIAIALWVILPYLFFSLVKTKMHAYVMMSAPAVFLIYSFFWYTLKNVKCGFKSKTLIWVVLILLLLLPLKDCYKRILSDDGRTPQWAEELRLLDKKIGDKNYVVFNINRPIEAMFYSSCTAYSFVPTAEDVQMLAEKGYKTVIYDSVKIPDNIRSDKRVTIVQSDVLSS